MENVITALFSEENEAYRAFSEIKQGMVSQSCIIAHLGLLKKQAGHIVVADAADSGVTTTDDTRFGGMMGMLIGIMGGPLVMLFGMAMGSMIGRIKDIGDAKKGVSLIEQVCTKLQDGDVALIALAQENDEKMLDSRLSPYKVEITRYPAAEVAAEVEQAMKLQEELASDARKKLREAKKAEIREKIVKKGEAIREEFNKIYSK